MLLSGTSIGVACSSGNEERGASVADGGGTSTEDGSTGGANDDDGGTRNADGGDVLLTLAGRLPTVVTEGGPVLTNPKVMAITYDNDTHRSDIEDFLSAFAASSSWPTFTKEYGVGALTIGAPKHLAGNAPAAPSDTEIRAELTQNLTAGNWGSPDPSTLYSFFYPNGSIVDYGPINQLQGIGGKCCTDFDGYHDELTVAGVAVPYAVMCQCPDFLGSSLTDVQQLTVVTSHEIVEAATDPFWSSNPAYRQTDASHFAWSYVSGGEVGDLCQYSAYWAPPDLNYTVQRMWSNAAAAAGHDPCVGSAPEPYYQTVPEQPDQVTIANENTVTTSSLKIAVGATGVLKIHVLADGAVGPLTISMLADPSVLTFDYPNDPVNPGDEVDVKVTVLRQDPNLGNAESFTIGTAMQGSSAAPSYFFGMISQ